MQKHKQKDQKIYQKKKNKKKKAILKTENKLIQSVVIVEFCGA